MVLGSMHVWMAVRPSAPAGDAGGPLRVIIQLRVDVGGAYLRACVLSARNLFIIY